MKLLEKTEKYFFTTQDEAEFFVEQQQKNEEGQLIDWKVSIKETSKDYYVIVTIKIRYLTLNEAKES